MFIFSSYPQLNDYIIFIIINVLFAPILGKIEGSRNGFIATKHPALQNISAAPID